MQIKAPHPTDKSTYSQIAALHILRYGSLAAALAAAKSKQGITK